MLELMEKGVDNIVCCQPFGCLPNHVVGKGVIKQLRAAHPQANIIAVDYDPGASEVNQLNRIKLMLATAQKNMEKKKAGLIPDPAAAAAEQENEARSAMEAAPEIDSEYASIGCVPDTSAEAVSSRKKKAKPSRRRGGGIFGLFRK
jgi:hypothetical protein